MNERVTHLIRQARAAAATPRGRLALLGTTATLALTAGTLVAVGGPDDRLATTDPTSESTATYAPPATRPDPATDRAARRTPTVATTTTTEPTAPPISTATEPTEPTETTETTEPSETAEPTGTTEAPAEPAGDPPAAAAPEESADPEPAPADPGAITQTGAQTLADRPVHPPVAPPPVEWDPVPLALVDSAVVTDDLAPSPPAPVDLPPLASDDIGDLTSNAFGCASNCISKAVVTFDALHPDLGFESTTKVATQIHVWIGTNEPTSWGGVPVIIGSVPIASDGFQHEWATTLADLDYATTYHVIVRATDQQGNQQYAVGSVTTIDAPATDLTSGGDGPGCVVQCITEGFVFPGDTYDVVDLVVLTTVYANFDVAISQQEPGTIDGQPFLPHDESFSIHQHNATGMRGTASGLSPDTRYHVVVSATDQDGYTSRATGTFRTAPAPPRVPPPTEVLIGFERVDVFGDGDPGSANRGEIAFNWGIGNYDPSDGGYRGYRDYEKIGSDETIHLPVDSGRWVSVPAGGTLPRVVVNALERDADGLSEVCTRGLLPVTMPAADPECDRTINVAKIEPQPLSWLDQWARCSAFGLIDFRKDAICVPFESPQMGDQFVNFRAVAWFYLA